MRARNLKPGFFSNEYLAVADPIYSIVFAGLWCSSDRMGRLEDRPGKIHLAINPGRAFETTERSLEWLSENGFIARYESSGVRYIWVKKFEEHQNPHQKEAPSKIPAHPEDMREVRGGPGASPVQAPGETKCSPADSGFLIPDSPSLTPDSPFTALAPQAQPPDSITSETPNGKTQATRKRKTPKSPEFPLPDDFGLDPELEQYTLDHLPSVNAKGLMDKFRLQAKTKQWQYADWRLAFMAYVRNCAPNSGHWASGQYPRGGSGGIQWQ